MKDWFGYFKFIWTHLQCDNDHCRTVKQFGEDTFETGIALLVIRRVVVHGGLLDQGRPHLQRFGPIRTQPETIKNPNNKSENTFGMKV